MTKKSFTIMELLIVVTLIGIIAAFAIPNYEKTMKRQQVKRLLMTANLIAGAEEIYKANNGQYSPACANIAAINTTLDLDIMAETGISYVTYIPVANTFGISITDGMLFTIDADSPPLNITCTDLTAIKVCP